MVALVTEKFQAESIDQYKLEERSIMAKRLISYHDRIAHLLNCMINDTLSKPEYVKQLRNEIYEFTSDVNFKKSKTMGDILKHALDFVKRNYEDVNMKNFY